MNTHIEKNDGDNVPVYDENGTAKHYSSERINRIRMFEQIWGTKNTMVFCEMNDFKYRMRMGLKNEDINLELTKANWYADMAGYLQDKIQKGLEVPGLDEGDSGMYSDFRKDNKLSYSRNLEKDGIQ
jgi:hypothetical protein